MSTPETGLSIAEKLCLLVKLIVLAPPYLLISLLRCYALATFRGISLRNYAHCAYFRCALHLLSPREVRFLAPPTLTVYKAWLTRRKSRAASLAAKKPNDTPAGFLASRLAIDIEPLPDGRSSLLWIGDRHRASKFVLFFHGGGYSAPALAGHLEWCARAYLLASPAAQGNGEDEVAVAVLQYTLASDAQYPTQLRQAADALAHVLRDRGVRPGNLVIGGDSAGGNLTAQVLGHLLRPHPRAKEVVLQEPLAGAFLVSPVLSVRGGLWPSLRRNGGIDMLSAKTASGLRSLVLEGAEGYEVEVAEQRGWAMPMDLEDPQGWFKGLDRVVNRVYVTAGEQETLLDQGVAFAEAVRRSNPEITVRLEVMKDEAHDWILIEGEKGVNGDAMGRMRSWFEGVFWP